MPVNKNQIPWKATVKAYPAIGDLQAPSGFVRIQDVDMNVGVPNYNQDVYTVPAGYMFVLEFLTALCFQATPTTIDFVLRSGGVNYSFYADAYGGAWETHRWTNKIIFNEDEIVRVVWAGTLAGTDVSALLFGYLIPKY